MKEKITDYINRADKLDEDWQFTRWRQRVKIYLLESMGEEIANKFNSLVEGEDEYDDHERQIGYLEALVASFTVKEKVSIVAVASRLLPVSKIRQSSRRFSSTSNNAPNRLKEHPILPELRPRKLDGTNLF